MCRYSPSRFPSGAPRGRATLRFNVVCAGTIPNAGRPAPQESRAGETPDPTNRSRQLAAAGPARIVNCGLRTMPVTIADQRYSDDAASRTICRTAGLS